MTAYAITPIAMVLQYLKENGLELTGEAYGFQYKLYPHSIRVNGKQQLVIDVDLVKSILEKERLPKNKH